MTYPKQRLILNVKELVGQYLMNPVLIPIFPYLSVQQLIGAVMSITIIEHDNTKLWNVLEGAIPPELFAKLDIQDIAIALEGMQFDFEVLIDVRQVLPHGWEPGMYVYDRWLSEHDIVLREAHEGREFFPTDLSYNPIPHFDKDYHHGAAHSHPQHPAPAPGLHEQPRNSAHSRWDLPVGHPPKRH